MNVSEMMKAHDFLLNHSSHRVVVRDFFSDMSVLAAGGKRTTGKQSWSQDLRASEKDQLLPLQPTLRSEAFDTSC